FLIVQQKLPCSVPNPIVQFGLGTQIFQVLSPRSERGAEKANGGPRPELAAVIPINRRSRRSDRRTHHNHFAVLTEIEDVRRMGAVTVGKTFADTASPLIALWSHVSISVSVTLSEAIRATQNYYNPQIREFSRTDCVPSDTGTRTSDHRTDRRRGDRRNGRGDSGSGHHRDR